MKIERVDVRAVKAPMPEPHRTASGAITVSPLVLVQVTTGDGVTGNAIGFAYTEAALGALAEMARGIAPFVIGQDLAPATITNALYAKFRLIGGQGIVAMAIAAYDMALWDAKARSAGVQLRELLGVGEKQLKPYGAVGFDGVEGSAKAAEALAKRGFLGIKAKIGYPDRAKDLEVVRAMRAAVGPDIALMVDYNQSLDATEAEARIRMLDGEGLTWIEEPVLAHDWDALGRLAQVAATPMMAGENWWGLIDFQHAFNAGARDRVMPDLGKCGGVTGWQRVTGLAAAHGIPVANHLWPEISAQMLCATPGAVWLEFCDWWNPVLEDPLRMRGGLVDFEGVTGSGVSFDEGAVRNYLA